MKWLLLLALFSKHNKNEPLIGINAPDQNKTTYSHLTLNNTVRDIVNHPAFHGFCEMLLPWENNSPYYNIPLKDVSSLMPYHSNVRPDVVLSSVNYMIDEVNGGKTIFYNIYSEEQKKRDPSLKQTGLFFFRGKAGAPFAIVCPGGGFSYVGSLQEGFPIAQEISKNELNVFARLKT